MIKNEVCQATAGAKRPRLELSSKDQQRSRRLFGALVGTLKTFKAQTGKKTEAEMKREELEKRLAEKIQKEKEELASKVKQEIEERKAKKAAQRQEDDAKRIAFTKEVLKNQTRTLSNFIKTKTDPPIFFLPLNHNDATIKLLQEAKRAAVFASRERSPGVNPTTGSVEGDRASETDGKDQNGDDVRMEEAGDERERDGGDMMSEDGA
ncbi:hypothetical protein HK104_004371 [Borealophlyctis nickersoniae]|nr:hypothetical protein HK104_004371 [Borealophlyctis nickersoniae]